MGLRGWGPDTLGVLGESHDYPNSKRAHLRVPRLTTPPKFHEKTTQRHKERNGSGGGGPAQGVSRREEGAFGGLPGGGGGFEGEGVSAKLSFAGMDREREQFQVLFPVMFATLLLLVRTTNLLP